MYSDFKECPDNNKIESFLLGELDSSSIMLLEEHFYHCDKCVDEARKILQEVAKYRILKASPILGMAWQKYGDKLEEFKCADSTTSDVREFETRNKKFKITLRAIEGKSDLSLLEIEVLDNSIKGSILVYIDGLREEVEIDSSRIACMIIKSNADLSKLIIRSY